MSPPPHPLFVYGTLKRGEINHGLLAPHACAIAPAWIHGTLYDTGDFPALLPGESRVRGELVVLDPEHAEAVIAIIDRLEGYIPDLEDLSLYHRRVVTATRAGGEQDAAYAYVYNQAHPSLPPVTSLRLIECGEWTGLGPSPAAGDLPEFEAYRAYVRGFAARTSPHREPR